MGIELNPLRYVEGFAAMAKGGLTDIASAAGGLGGNSTDEWDPEYIRRALPVMDTLFSTYFRGEVRGLENIPDGPSLLVGNHSGGTMIADTFVFTMKFYERFGPERRFHQLAHNIAAQLPGLGIRPFGTLVASHDNAKKAFALDAPVLVYPGGDWETFRPSWQGAKIDFGGRQGWIKLALEERVPIVPVVSIGGQETALFVTRGERAAKLLGLDRFARIKVLPVSIGPPWGVNFLDLPGRIPLPAKITLEVKEPIDLYKRYGSEPDLDRVYREVTEEMQGTLDELAEERTLPVVG